jgi:multidrug efflux system outer membrane protein
VDRLTSQQREVAAQRDRAELATLRYQNGVANFLEVLDAQRELFAAEQQVLLTRREQLTNAVDLYVALGGGIDSSNVPAEARVARSDSGGQ